MFTIRVIGYIISCSEKNNYIELEVVHREVEAETMTIGEWVHDGVNGISRDHHLGIK